MSLLGVGGAWTKGERGGRGVEGIEGIEGIEGVEGGAGEEVHVGGGGFFPPSDSRSWVGGGVGGAGVQSNCEGDGREGGGKLAVIARVVGEGAS